MLNLITTRCDIKNRCYLIGLLALVSMCAMSSEPSPLQVTLIPEMRVLEHHGIDEYHYRPALKIKQGQEIFYTVRIINTTNEKAKHPVVIQPVPTNTHLIEGSVTGTGAAISYSIDGGKTFASMIELSDGSGDDTPITNNITHVRWQFRHAVAPHAMVLARFRVVFD
jgi:uncharacterized repeat protein (TIGR01451 family)